MKAQSVCDNPLWRRVSSSSPVPIPGWKRALDIGLFLAAFPLLLPLALLIACLIRMVSPGPVLFKQERVGYRGSRFLCFKFRTMVVNADTTVHQGYLHHLMNSNVPMVKMDARGDPRMIPFGALLRSSGLDELPQLINVLRGEMSLVGPRPCLPYEYDRYLPWQKERFDSAPGLSGLWQVSGKNRTTFVEMIRLDIHYARNKTFWLDLKIILKTVPALIGQMRDARQRQKPLSRPARSEAVVPALTANRYSLRGAAFTAVIQTNRQSFSNQAPWNQ
ncbi:MAG: sugar transferase [Verrucomicrobiota bacterium]